MTNSGLQGADEDGAPNFCLMQRVSYKLEFAWRGEYA